MDQDELDALVAAAKAKAMPQPPAASPTPSLSLGYAPPSPDDDELSHMVAAARAKEQSSTPPTTEPLVMPGDAPPLTVTRTAPAGGAPSPLAQQPLTTAGDVQKSFGTGLMQGAAATGGAVGDASDWLNFGPSYLIAKGAEKLGFLPPGKTAEDLIKDANKVAETAPTTTLGKIDSAFHAPTTSDLNAGIQSVAGPYHKPETTPGKYANTVGQFLPGAVTTGLADPRTMTINALRYGVIPGMTSEAAGEATADTRAEPWARLAGGVFGAAAAPSMLNAPGRMISPMSIPPERQAMIDALMNHGVDMTAGQRTGNRTLQFAESHLSEVPLGGNKAEEVAHRQGQQFTSAALRAAGIDAPLATPEVMANAYEDFGRRFRNLASRNTLRIDNQLGSEIGGAVQNYNDLTAPSSRAPGIAAAAHDLQTAYGSNMAGNTYQALRSQFGQQAQALRMSDPPQSQAYRRLRDALDNAMDRSIQPEDAGAWAQLRGQYGNYKALEKAVGAAGPNAAAGYVSPAQLRGAIATGNNRGAYARGEGDLNELARAGVGVLTPLPNSGTAPRQAIERTAQLLGTVGGAFHGGGEGALLGLAGGTIAPAAMGRALMSAPAQAYLSNQVAPRLGLMTQVDPHARALAQALIGHATVADLVAHQQQ